MANIIHIEDRRHQDTESQVDGEDSATFDDMLLTEGLDLLNAYRSIDDRSMRVNLKKLVEDVAALNATRTRV